MVADDLGAGEMRGFGIEGEFADELNAALVIFDAGESGASRRAVQPRWVVATLVLLGVLSFAVVQWRPTPQLRLSAEETEARAVYQQAGIALAYLRHHAKEVSQQCGVIIFKSSLLSLRKSLCTAQEFIARPKPSEGKPN